MNTRLIHVVVFLLLLSLTAHEMHAAVSHDAEEACEVCIHVQSNDDVLPAAEPHYLLLDVAYHVKIKSTTQTFQSNTSCAADPIRGPPQFSLV